MSDEDVARLIAADELEDLGEWEQAAWLRIQPTTDGLYLGTVPGPGTAGGAVVDVGWQLYVFPTVVSWDELSGRKAMLVVGTNQDSYLWVENRPDKWVYRPCKSWSREVYEESPRWLRKLIEDAARLVVGRLLSVTQGENGIRP